MKNHTITIVSTSKFAHGIILRCLRIHITPCPAATRMRDIFITISSRKGYVNYYALQFKKG